MESLRRSFGIAEPVRRGMELKLAREGEWRPQALGGSAGVHGEILAGRDAEVAWEDVYRGMLLFPKLGRSLVAAVDGETGGRVRDEVFGAQFADLGGRGCCR